VSPERFEKITGRYAGLRIAVAGDFCLDRYLEIDPRKEEISIETGLPVYNVVRVRSQPGAAGTILNNLAALGVGTLYPIGFAGEDGEGYELSRCLKQMPGVDLKHFQQTAERRTFTYCKPLVIESGKSPRELNRLDSKNWSATPETLSRKIKESLQAAAGEADAIIVMDQVDVAETGVITKTVLKAIEELCAGDLLIVADSRRGLKNFPPITYKMNAGELAKLAGRSGSLSLEEVKREAAALARKMKQGVFVTMAEAGIVGSDGSGAVEHVAAFPVRGEIDVVGAGDAVMANLTCALAAGAQTAEALQLANGAASVVIHQLGTTGTANIVQLRDVLHPTNAHATAKRGT
jgi:rfaE bifunctional protein kinase chain/domain